MRPRKNPAVPGWQQRRFGEWQTSEPGLTPGHHALPETRIAAHLAGMAVRLRRALAEGDFDTASRLGIYLGRGHFGETYLVQAVNGAWVVKLPVSHDSHGVAYPIARARRDFVHEAGNANQLTKRGFGRLVPASVFVELHDGTPAIVREYGEPVLRPSLAEYLALEEGLAALESRAKWRISDDLSVYRRPDGSLYIGDVGIWEPTPRGSRDDSSLGHLLASFARPILPGIRSLHTLPSLVEFAGRLENNLTEHDDFSAELATEHLIEAVGERAQLGLPVPVYLYNLLARAQAFLAPGR